MNGNFLNHKKNPLIVITRGPQGKAVTLGLRFTLMLTS